MNISIKPLIIAVLNQKGGCGKTTVSINLAHSFKNSGYKVLIVDGDPQGSARDWNAANNGELLPVIGLDRPSLQKDIEAVRSGYDIIIIDGAPQIAQLSAVAIKAADLVLMPVQPSPYDVWAVSDLIDLIKARQEITDNQPLAAFVISRVIKNTKLGKEVIEALKNYELPVLKSYTTQRVIYPTSASTGQTVYSIGSNEASLEIDAIRDEIIEIIYELNNQKTKG